MRTRILFVVCAGAIAAVYGCGDDDSGGGSGGSSSGGTGGGATAGAGGAAGASGGAAGASGGAGGTAGASGGAGGATGGAGGAADAGTGGASGKWYCAEPAGVSVCDCKKTPIPNGTLSACAKSYSCCISAKVGGYDDCACENASTDECNKKVSDQAAGGAKKVASCPPP